MDLELILKKHKLWLRNETGGEMADLKNVNLEGANLRSVDLRAVDLRGANLSSADMSGANLANTVLYNVDFTNTNLSGVDINFIKLGDCKLRGTILDDEFIYIGNIGSRNSQTIVNLTKDIVVCGCFSGTLKEFEQRVKSVYGGKNKNKHYYDYIDFIKLCNKRIKRLNNTKKED